MKGPKHIPKWIHKTDKDSGGDLS